MPQVGQSQVLSRPEPQGPGGESGRPSVWQMRKRRLTLLTSPDSIPLPSSFPRWEQGCGTPELVACSVALRPPSFSSGPGRRVDTQTPHTSAAGTGRGCSRREPRSAAVTLTNRCSGDDVCLQTGRELQLHALTPRPHLPGHWPDACSGRRLPLPPMPPQGTEGRRATGSWASAPKLQGPGSRLLGVGALKTQLEKISANISRR